MIRPEHLIAASIAVLIAGAAAGLFAVLSGNGGLTGAAFEFLHGEQPEEAAPVVDPEPIIDGYIKAETGSQTVVFDEDFVQHPGRRK